MSFELLAEPIRRYIRDKRWESLRPIQTAAIAKILSTTENYILASRTASGKTEAAFLPILSKVNFTEPGVQVLYISPLIALINDQFYRIEALCKYLEVDVTKWHGEANRTLKNKLVSNPSGIVLITPESLEAMFVHSPYKVKELFSNLKFIVIDEIHSFIGTDRGIHLKSILCRLQQVNKGKLNLVGLSATIGDYNEAKKFTGDEANTKVLLDRTAKEMEMRFKYFEGETTELPLELLKDLYVETEAHKTLIFPNSRGRAEEIAVKLKKLSERVRGHPFYFSHHSSVDKELREYVEHFAKSNQRSNFCISCTSTLELGIDIGTVDKVVQIDATHSISSLIQRVGRSGRREGERSHLLLYATDKWTFLQALACWILYQEGFIEPTSTSERSYDILLHQILSLVKERSGCKRNELVKEVEQNYAFKKILKEEIEEIVQHLINTDMLELLQGELIIGIEGEKVVNSKDFYSVFKSEPNFKVVSAGKSVGEIPFSPQVRPDENILLAARIWKITDVDFTASKILVIPAKDGKKPLFFGTGGIVHSRVREKMLQILFETTEYPELDKKCSEVLQALRNEFSSIQIENLTDDRPVIHRENSAILFSFQATKVNRSLYFLLNKAGFNPVYDERSSSFNISIEVKNAVQFLEKLMVTFSDIDFHLENDVRSIPTMLDFCKWGNLLPVRYQIEILKERYFDFEATRIFIESIRPLTINSVEANKSIL